MTLEDRIRTEGRRLSGTMTTSPRLDERIVGHTRRRIRQRRQRTTIGIGLGAVAIVAAGIAVINGPADRSVRLVPASAPIDTPDSAAVATSSTVELPTNPSSMPSMPPTSFYSVDPLTMTATEYDLSGFPLRGFPVSRLADERLASPGGDEIVLGATPGGHAFDGDVPCQNRSITIGDASLHPDLAAARVAGMANGVLYAARSVCAAGLSWGDPGTGWELVKLDMRNAGNGQVEVLHFYPSDHSEILPDLTDSLTYSPRQLKVTPDGAAVLIGVDMGSPPAQDVWSAIPTAEPAKPLLSAQYGCGLDLAYAGDGVFVTSCAGASGLSYDVLVLSNVAGALPRTTTNVQATLTTAAYVSARGVEGDPMNPYILITSVEGPTALESAIIHDGVAIPFTLAAHARGAAWSLDELGYVEMLPETFATSTTTVPVALPDADPGQAMDYSTTTIEIPDVDPGPATITVRHDSEL